MVRLNLEFTKNNVNLIKQASRQNKISMTKLLNALVEQKLADPIKVLQDKKKNLIIEINKLDDQIKHLEDLQND